MDPQELKEESLRTRPAVVCLIGLGVSRLSYGDDYMNSQCNLRFDEVWTVNYGGRIYCHDKLWVMDDMRDIAQRERLYGDFLKSHDRPIITTKAYREFPMAVEYPIKDVVEKVGDDFFSSTVSYAIAWAMVNGVKELYLYGCDFHYPNQGVRELGGQGSAYLLGLARHFGMTFRIPPSTTFMDGRSAKPVKGPDGKTYLRRTLYGYKEQPFIPRVDEVDNDRESRPFRPKEVSADGSRAEGSARLREGEGQGAVAADQGAALPPPPG